MASPEVIHLSDHFTLRDCQRSSIASRHGIDNTAPQEAVEAFTRVCLEALEPIRACLGVPMRVTSGYRCQRVNEIARGSRTSAHLFGLACDFEPIGMTCTEAFEKIAREKPCAWDQLILECGPDGWIHVGLKDSPADYRGSTMTAEWNPKKNGTGGWDYLPFHPA